jgi:hypothetical protein
MGLLDRITEITADVTGEKAAEGLSRVAKFNIAFTIRGDIDEETRRTIAHAAESEICTVSNTIRGDAEFSTVVSGRSERRACRSGRRRNPREAEGGGRRGMVCGPICRSPAVLAPGILLGPRRS